MTKLTDYVKVAEAAEILVVSQGTLRTSAKVGKIPMSRNSATGYRPFRREDLENSLKQAARPANKNRKEKNR